MRKNFFFDEALIARLGRALLAICCPFSWIGQAKERTISYFATRIVRKGLVNSARRFPNAPYLFLESLVNRREESFTIPSPNAAI